MHSLMGKHYVCSFFYYSYVTSKTPNRGSTHCYLVHFWHFIAVIVHVSLTWTLHVNSNLICWTICICRCHRRCSDLIVACLPLAFRDSLRVTHIRLFGNRSSWQRLMEQTVLVRTAHTCMYLYGLERAYLFYLLFVMNNNFFRFVFFSFFFRCKEKWVEFHIRPKSMIQSNVHHSHDIIYIHAYADGAMVCMFEGNGQSIEFDSKPLDLVKIYIWGDNRPEISTLQYHRNAAAVAVYVEIS